MKETHGSFVGGQRSSSVLRGGARETQSAAVTAESICLERPSSSIGGLVADSQEWRFSHCQDIWRSSKKGAEVLVSGEEWCCGQCGREGPESDDSSSGRSEQQTAEIDFAGLQGGSVVCSARI